MGNFGWVIEDVYEKAYAPLIGALERHPGVRLALHYSGPLLEWLDAERPEAISRLRALVERGQVEILGGGLYEPILTGLPERDRLGQLRRMRDEVERRFGVAPRGAWLAERVWEPSLPAALVDAGYAYTVLDDNHLRGAFVPEDAMWGTYTTDDQGRLLTIFGTEKGLRYRIPWKPVADLLEYLRQSATDAGERLGIMGDDGEKFGAWPGTHELCWTKEKWVERCFEALEANADWLATVTPSEWMADHPPIGRVYIPTTAYVEMTEWALPADEQPVFHALLERATEEQLPEARFLRGGLWRNFQVRYREINELHKQMLRVSDAVERMAEGEAQQRARDHLYRGQSNDCYWHGWFGGIYIVHMRMATLAELIAAEDLALGEASAMHGVADYDLDGVDEVALGTPGQTLVVDVAEGAGISEWDLRPTRVALASVLRRRPEAYHAAIIEKDAELAQAIEYDDHERRSALVRVLDRDGKALGDFDRGPWQVEMTTKRELVVSRASGGLFIRKKLLLDGGRSEGSLTCVVEVTPQAAFEGTLELEWNINLLGGGGNPDAYYRWATHEARHDSHGSVEAGVGLAMGNRYAGVEITVNCDPPAAQEWFAVETVSNSESGLEKVYQGSCLTQRWAMRLAAGASIAVSATLASTQTSRPAA